MNVTSQLFESYLYCPTKCWLQSRCKAVSGNMYAEWAREEAYYKDGLKPIFNTFR